MNQDVIDICWLKRNGKITASWDEIAEKYGYTDGEKIRLAFKSLRRKLDRESKCVDVCQPMECLFEDFKSNFKTNTQSQKPRLVISDIHLPFAVEGWLEFIKQTHSKFDCDDEIIINGDLIDLHQYSFHTSETSAMSGLDEFDKAKEMVKMLYMSFPKARWILGNHCNIIVRRLKEMGIDKRFTKTFHELFDLPHTWLIMDDCIIDNVYYKHIGCCGGKTGAIQSAISNRMSTVVSHLHADGGVSYSTSPNGDTIFGMNSGAMCDDDSYAFAYGKNSRFKATLGCGVVVNNKEAYFVPFNK